MKQGEKVSYQAACAGDQLLIDGRDFVVVQKMPSCAYIVIVPLEMAYDPSKNERTLSEYEFNRLEATLVQEAN